MQSSADTSPRESANDAAPETLGRFQEVLATSALFIFRLAAESVGVGTSRVFVPSTAQTAHSAPEAILSSTKPVEIPPESISELERLWDEAHSQVIEDGMDNAVTQRLAGVIAKNFNSIVPAIVGSIESARIAPIISAEVFKEFGRIQDPRSHAIRKWALVHGLDSPSVVVRDGAGLGLARLADPTTLDPIKKALEKEADVLARQNLQLVADEIAPIT